MTHFHMLSEKRKIYINKKQSKPNVKNDYFVLLTIVLYVLLIIIIMYLLFYSS